MFVLQELGKLDESIQLLKKLQLDYNLFDSIAADLDDSVQSKIKIEIEHMDRLLNKITDLNSRTSECHNEKKNEIFARSSAALAELEIQLSATTEEEEGILKEASLLEGSEEESERKELMAELENRKMNVTNGRIELVAARDDAEALLFRELKELERQNEDLLRELEAAADEVTEHEVTYQRLISEVLRENETRREKMLELMNEMRTAGDGWTIGEDDETKGGLDADVLSSKCVDVAHTDETEAKQMDSESLTKHSGDDKTRYVDSERSTEGSIEIRYLNAYCTYN